MRKIKLVIVPLLIIAVFVACAEKELVIDDVHHYLSEAVTIETEFESYQNELNELEKKDTVLYNRIVEISDDDTKEKESLVNEANDVLNEKKDVLKMIREMLQKSKVEFEQIEPLIDELEEQNYQDQVQKMYNAMMDRYNAFEQLYESYIISIELTVKLYDQILLENNESSAIFTTIKQVNESYDEIKEMNELFNENTITYNALKSDFYDLIEKSD